jgi:hypothetical protein
MRHSKWVLVHDTLALPPCPVSLCSWDFDHRYVTAVTEGRMATLLHPVPYGLKGVWRGGQRNAVPTCHASRTTFDIRLSCCTLRVRPYLPFGQRVSCFVFSFVRVVAEFACEF